MILVRIVVAGVLAVPSGVAGVWAADGSPAAVVEQRRFIGSDGERLPFRTDEEVREFLRAAKVLTIAEIPVGVTRPRKVLLEKDGVRAHAVFRTIRSEKERVRLDDGKFVFYLRDDYRSEVAAYELAQLLGLDSIPPVVERSVNREPGSLQLWIENAMTEGDRQQRKLEPPDLERWRRQMFTVALFDNLINNIDRNIGNMLVDPEWTVWMIDHTRSFGRERKLIDPTRLKRCEPELWRRLTALDDATIRRTLQPWMGRFEIDSLLDRRRQIIKIVRQHIAEEGEEKVFFGSVLTME